VLDEDKQPHQPEQRTIRNVTRDQWKEIAGCLNVNIKLN